MKLRLILLVLSLMAIVFATAGGGFYYSSLKKAALKEAERETIIRHKIKTNRWINLAMHLLEY